MPTEINEKDLVAFRRGGRKEGETAQEIRSAIRMLKDGVSAVALEFADDVSKERISTTSSRIAKSEGVRVSVRETGDNKYALVLNNSPAPERKSKEG